MAKETGRRATSDAPKSAANYVRRGAAAIQSRDASAVPTTRARAEYLALIDFATRFGKVLPSNCVDGFRYQGYGAEHRVYHDFERKRAVKVTHPNTFGHCPYGPGVRALPTEYFYRMAWCNVILGDDFKFHGIIVDGEQLEIVTSHPWISAHPFREHPERVEIDAYFQKFEFVPRSSDPNAPIYYNDRSGLVILDAHDTNVIRDEAGILFAIDVVIGRPGPDLKRSVEEFVAPRFPFFQ
jgi:hypothetical protein